MLSTVLIIDKRVELSTKYKKCIDSSDVKAVITRTLKEAFVAVQSLEPDMIIISDSIEEKLSSFCQKIRALTFNTRPIIVALSKSAEATDRIDVLENGADDFLSEPVNIDEFKTRINAHLRREIESNLDNKTLLPNEKLTKKAIKRLFTSDNQAILLAGIQNLKSYKSIYTELAADKIVQTFIAIIKSATNEEDFIGQLDDENFIIITNKYSAEKLANFLTFAFDTVVPKFYSQNDISRGYVLLEGERYAEERINFVSVLIGGIIDGLDNFSLPGILIEKLAEIKGLAKIPSGSNYLIERTRLAGNDSIADDIPQKTIYIKEKDDSLEYLMRTALELQGYDIQEDLDTENSIQPSLIIMDSENDLSGLELLKNLKSNRNFVNTKIIVTTTIHDKSAVLDSGADLYLPKPYEISDLIRWVEYFIKKQ